jgi:hypothetical protein
METLVQLFPVEVQGEAVEPVLGTRWSNVSISGPGSFNELLSVSAVSASDVWAGRRHR